MNKDLFLGVVLLLLMQSCGQSPVHERMEELREDFRKTAKAFNEQAAYKAAHDPEDSIYALIAVGMDTALCAVDRKIKQYPFQNDWAAIKGNIYFHFGQYRNAANVFNFCVYAVKDHPGYLAAQAIALSRVGSLDSAIAAAKKAAEINHEFDQLVARIFELSKQRDSARFYYFQIGVRDTVRNCDAYTRWRQLNSVETPLLRMLPDSLPYRSPDRWSVRLN